MQRKSKGQQQQRGAADPFLSCADYSCYAANRTGSLGVGRQQRSVRQAGVLPLPKQLLGCPVIAQAPPLKHGSRLR